ncbi:MerR family transcriptional regulator [Schaalia sp. 19OD2882]|nr:MerR family transcriptional regulator [Schaalia sp. 19OD2882]
MPVTTHTPSDIQGDGLTVGQVAALVGVSVRTLHHWDQIGLASPSSRTWSGYRVYEDADVARVQQVLVYRETGMALADIAEVLDSPGADARTHLELQRQALLDRIAHLQRMVRAVDTMMERHDMGNELTNAERAELLGAEWSNWEKYHDEAEQRWGDTAAWAQSRERQARMSREDWTRVKDEAERLETDLASAMMAGVQPGSAEANALAERHRASIDQWFDTSLERQVCIARGYVADTRFAAHYDKRAAGLAAWLVDIINANARAQGVDPDSAQWG